MPSKAKKPHTHTGPSKSQPLTNLSKTTSANSQTANSAQPLPTPGARVNGQHVDDKRDSESKTGDTTESAGELTNAPSVNRKKQKRREKEAARRAAQQGLANGHVASPSPHNGQPHHQTQGRGPTKGYFTEDVDPSHPEFADLGSPDDAFYSGDEDLDYDHLVSGPPNTSWLNTSKRKKSKKKGSNPGSNAISRTSTAVSRPNFPSVSNAALRSAHRMGDSLWNPSTQAERENIKQFWLDLGEEERRSLVKIEKEAVLRKMKEQQKHSCSCSVCGRKRTAIEEELEVLYDAYYEELEQFANHNPDLANAPQLMAPPRPTLRRGPQPIPGSFSSRGRVHEIGDEDEDLDEDEDYDDEDEPYSDEDGEDLDVHGLPPGPPDFFQFGNSLTVKDGILTVADDLLKNDGRHFIDMMEQLAERRMQREEEVHFPSSALAHQDIHQGHNHAPIDEEDDYDEEEEDDEDDYDSQEEDDFEGDEMDSMTEEQRMEEGRRMFQIFAARMFEQRVLTAYREKVAAERQARLLEELDEENRLDTQREAKKAREAAKKKEKKKAQKQAKDEEKAKKEAEKAAQEAAAREAEEKRQEEQRQRKEEQRKKRESERKAAEEERLRKEAEKQRRQQEQKERQAEAERKAREAKDRERQKREESKKKEREEREAREKEARERKAKEAQERKAKEEQARKEKEAATAVKAEKEAKDRVAQLPAGRPQPVALPPGLHPPSRGPSLQSPNFAVATPVVPPKVSTPGRGRQTSQTAQQGQSHSSSPRSQLTGTEQSSTSPPSVTVPQPPGPPQTAKAQGQPPMLHHPQPSAPRSPLNNPGRNQHVFNMNGLPGLGVGGPPPSGPGMMPGMMPQMPMYQGPPMGHHPRFGPNGMQYPQNFGGPRHFQPTQPMPFHTQGPSTAPVQAPQNPAPKPTHSRQPSGSTTTESSSQPAPIARPGPIARPSSTTPDRQKSKEKGTEPDVEQITTQLGSKALLDDSDEPIPSNPESRTGLAPVGAPGTGRIPFASSFESKQESFGMGSQGWGGFGSASGWGAPGPQRAGAAWPQQPFGAMNHAPPAVQRSHLPRPIAVRLMLVQACRHLSGSGESYHPVQSVLAQLEMLKAPGEPPVSMDEMLEICDTEGNAQNGGGSFEVIMDQSRGQVIKFTGDMAPPRRSVGDIGSPIPSHAQPSSFPVGFGPPGRGF